MSGQIVHRNTAPAIAPKNAQEANQQAATTAARNAQPRYPDGRWAPAALPPRPAPPAPTGPTAPTVIETANASGASGIVAAPGTRQAVPVERTVLGG